MQIPTLGIDLAKSVFQLHGVDASGQIVLQKKLRRSLVLDTLSTLPPCMVGNKACATGHFWAREISALGHDVRLIPPRYVKPYVKRQKNDMADAEAICEAVTRPNMHFVAIKSADQQAVLMLHRARDLLVRQRTMLINALRAHLAELGIVAAQGPSKIRDVCKDLAAKRLDIPDAAQSALCSLVGQLDALETETAELELRIKHWHQRSAVSQRLATIPGVGIITATALAATIADPS